MAEKVISPRRRQIRAYSGGGLAMGLIAGEAAGIVKFVRADRSHTKTSGNIGFERAQNSITKGAYQQRKELGAPGQDQLIAAEAKQSAQIVSTLQARDPGEQGALDLVQIEAGFMLGGAALGILAANGIRMAINHLRTPRQIIPSV